MFATFSCASAASGILGKNVRKSLYSISACCIAVEPPSAYHESATASLARAINSESGYVLIRVCSVIRATSKRLCFMASMALSKRTLSGCFEPTFDSGLTDFLFVQAAVINSSIAKNATNGIRRDIKPQLRIFSRQWLIFDLKGRPGLPSQLKLLYLGHCCFGRRLQQCLRILSWIAAAEHGVARHQNFRPGADHIGHRVERDPAIHLDAEVQTLPAANLR